MNDILNPPYIKEINSDTTNSHIELELAPLSPNMLGLLEYERILHEYRNKILLDMFDGFHDGREYRITIHESLRLPDDPIPGHYEFDVRVEAVNDWLARAEIPIPKENAWSFDHMDFMSMVALRKFMKDRADEWHESDERFYNQLHTAVLERAKQMEEEKQNE